MKDKFEDIIQQKFEGVSSPVPSGAWAGVSSGIAGGVSASFLGSTLIKGLLGLALAGSITVMVVILNQPKDETKPQKSINQITQESLSGSENIDESVLNRSSIEEPHENRTEVSTATRKENTPRKPSAIEGLPEIAAAEHQNEEKKTDQYVGEENSSLSHSEGVINGTKLKDELYSSENIPNEPAPDSNNEIAQSSVKDSPVPKLPSGIRSIQKSGYTYHLALNTSLAESFNVKWFIDDQLVSSSDQFRHEFNSPGEYTAMAIIQSEQGEEKRLFDNISVQPIAKIKVPETFTPHTSPNFNDTFDIDHSASEYVEDYFIEVYTLNGGLVFKSTKEKKAWDGLLNGSPAPEGTYNYKIMYWAHKGSPKPKLGKVVLQR